MQGYENNRRVMEAKALSSHREQPTMSRSTPVTAWCLLLVSLFIIYGTALTQVYTHEHITLEYLEDCSHSKCESSEITRASFAR